MADPQHTPVLDPFDRLTVRLYRTGLGAAALGLVAMAGAVVGEIAWLRNLAELVVVGGAATAVANMHLYDKRIRWIIGASAWVGALLLVAAPLTQSAEPVVHHAGLGFVFVSLSAFALKEQFCFKIPLLRAVPAFLALSLIPLLTDQPIPAAMLLGMSGLVYGALVIAKVRMPLHFDVGNKSAYQI